MGDYFEKFERRCNGCTCKSELFELLKDDELTLVDKNKITVMFKKGETIKKQGTFMSHVLSLNSGLAKLYLEGLEDRNAILRIVKPTNFIGGPGIYLDQLHHFTVTALMDSSVCFIDLQVFKQVIDSNKAFALEFMKDFSSGILSVYNRLINLTQKQMPGRMADTLLYLFNEIFESTKFPKIISSYDLADLSGMSKDSAVKVLRGFDKDKIIRVTDTEMTLLDLEALKTISRIG
jgi:CRP/FNR family transcriptional regulator, polysaccharide utilization system transcription regulator